MYRTLQFRSGWPCEWVFDAHENPVAPGARDLAEAIVQELKQDLPNTTEVSQHSYYGWSYETEYEGATFHQVINPTDEVFLTVRYQGYWWHWLLLRGPHGRLERYCGLLAAAVRRVPGLSDLHWIDENPTP